MPEFQEIGPVEARKLIDRQTRSIVTGAISALAGLAAVVFVATILFGVH